MMAEDGKIKNARIEGLVVLLAGVVVSLIICGVYKVISLFDPETLVVPALVIAVPSALPAVGVVFLLGGERAKQAITVKDESNLSGGQIIFYLSTAVLAIGYYFLFHLFLSSLGYR